MTRIDEQNAAGQGGSGGGNMQLWQRLTQQEQHLRVRIKVERDLEVCAAGQGLPVVVAYHRSLVTHQERELKTLLWIMAAAQEQLAELATLRAALAAPAQASAGGEVQGLVVKWREFAEDRGCHKQWRACRARCADELERALAAQEREA